jgi:glycosyltransferase involved in cell wall biosynthesis
VKFLFITTYDKGGAAVATLRMHNALLEAGHQSFVLVKEKTIENNNIISIKEIRRYPFLSRVWTSVRFRITKLTRRKRVITDSNYCFYNLDERLNTFDFNQYVHKFPFIPDIIVPCWTSDFMNFAMVSCLQKLLKAKVFWWGLDMSPLTGGCHYAWDCTGYTKDCTNCPAVLDLKYKDFPALNLKIKKEILAGSDMKFIAGSEYLVKQAKNSTLFSFQQKIPKVLMCINDSIFNDKQRSVAKSDMEISPDQKAIFFGLTFVQEKRKGLKYFIDALRKLQKKIELEGSFVTSKDIVILMAGNELSMSQFLRDIPFKVKIVGFIHNEKLLANAYRASDLFVCPSLEDSGPMMINESVMCGTPVVSFNIGVAEDLVVEGISGYKATLYNTDELADGMFNVLNRSSDSHRKLVESTKAIAMQKTEKKVVVNEFIKVVSE